MFASWFKSSKIDHAKIDNYLKLLPQELIAEVLKYIPAKDLNLFIKGITGIGVNGPKLLNDELTRRENVNKSILNEDLKLPLVKRLKNALLHACEIYFNENSIDKNKFIAFFSSGQINQNRVQTIQALANSEKISDVGLLLLILALYRYMNHTKFVSSYLSTTLLERQIFNTKNIECLQDLSVINLLLKRIIKSKSNLENSKNENSNSVKTSNENSNNLKLTQDEQRLLKMLHESCFVISALLAELCENPTKFQELEDYLSNFKLENLEVGKISVLNQTKSSLLKQPEPTPLASYTFY